MINRPSQAEESLALAGASLKRATMDEMTASTDGGIPFKMDVVGQRSLRYSDGIRTIYRQRTLAIRLFGTLQTAT